VLLGEFVVGLELVLANTKLICNVVFVEKELICGLGISFGGDFCWGWEFWERILSNSWVAVGCHYVEELVCGDRSDCWLGCSSDCRCLGGREFCIGILVGSCGAIRFKFLGKARDSSIWLCMGLSMCELRGSIKSLP
jgi:hypothetical protein